MLPLHCPRPEDSLWNSHPRVYVPVEDTGHARCPYCGTEFVMVGGDEAEGPGDASVDTDAAAIFGAD